MLVERRQGRSRPCPTSPHAYRVVSGAYRAGHSWPSQAGIPFHICALLLLWSSLSLGSGDVVTKWSLPPEWHSILGYTGRGPPDLTVYHSLECDGPLPVTERVEAVVPPVPTPTLGVIVSNISDAIPFIQLLLQHRAWAVDLQLSSQGGARGCMSLAHAASWARAVGVHPDRVTSRCSTSGWLANAKAYDAVVVIPGVAGSSDGATEDTVACIAPVVQVPVFVLASPSSTGRAWEASLLRTGLPILTLQYSLKVRTIAQRTPGG